jgi:HK97 family phage major capsid protein
MTIKDLKDNRNKLLTQAQAILLDTPDAEKRTSAMKMLADADALETDVTALESIAKRELEERSRTAPVRAAIGETAVTTDAEKGKAEKRAFETYIKTGHIDRSHLVETRDITTTTGAYMVPQQFDDVLHTAMLNYGTVLNDITQKKSDTGAPMKYATVDDVTTFLTVVGEDSTVSEVDPATMTGAIISTDFMTTSAVLVTFAQLQDSAFSVDEFIGQIFARRYYAGLSKMVTNGNSSNIGSLKTSAYVGHTTASATAISWSDVAATFSALDIAYSPTAIWSMNQTTRGALLATVDSLGRPLYIPAATSASFDTLLGKRVSINPFLDNPTAGLFPILYGAMENYLLINVNPGLSILRLNERYADKGCVGYIGYTRNGGTLVNAGTNPIISMQMA